MLALLALSAAALATSPSLEDHLVHYTGDAAASTELVKRLESRTLEVAGALRSEPERTREALRLQVVANLQAKRADGFPMDADRIARQVIDYEAFKLQSYVTSGVFPKRYFGYFDGLWDTAARERELQDAVRISVETLNRLQADRGRPVRMTEIEIAVTFISEGGAILLREQQRFADQIHPIADIGLDDIALGFTRHADEVAALDAALGTDLLGIVEWREINGEQEPFLAREMTFTEGIAGTALMYLYEKEICADKLAAEGRAALHTRDLDDQFILSSLVYNSGILFSEERLRMIRGFSTGDYLYETSERNARQRPRLNLLPPLDAMMELFANRAYRTQHTSWNAVYHILQRYGGFVGLRRFTDAYDEQGAAAPLPPLPAPEPAPSEEAPGPEASDGAECAAVAGGSGAWWAAVLVWAGWTRRQRARPR